MAIPDCPITGETLVDPVSSPRGHTYSRHAIVEWLEYHGSSPLTRLPLSVDKLVPNFALREMLSATDNNSTNGVVRKTVFPITLTIDVDRMWGAKSVLLFSSSVLARWKKEFLRLLQERTIIAFEMDTRNETPHIALGSTSLADLSGRRVVVCEPAIHISRNVVELDTGTGTHLTMVYAKNVGDKRRDIMAALRDSLAAVICPISYC